MPEGLTCLLVVDALAILVVALGVDGSLGCVAEVGDAIGMVKQPTALAGGTVVWLVRFVGCMPCSVHCKCAVPV